MAGLFWGLNQIIPGKPSLARPASGFFFLSVFFFFLSFFLDFYNKVWKLECLKVEWWGEGRRKTGDPWLQGPWGTPPFAWVIFLILLAIPPTPAVFTIKAGVVPICVLVLLQSPSPWSYLG